MSKPIYDVFLSFNQRDKGLAKFVVDALEDQGVHVFGVDNLQPGVSINKAIRNSLVECSSVIVLATPSSIESQHLAFEVGMALGWSKPIFVLYDGISLPEIPPFLRQYQFCPVTQIADVAQTIVRSRSALADAEKDTLLSLYSQRAIPVDSLISNPSLLGELTDDFNAQTGLQVQGERIARTLMVLRKSGRLPRVKQPAHPA